MDVLCLLLLLPFCRSIEVIVPDVPITGMLDEDVILPCSFSPPDGFSLHDLSLFWEITKLQQVHAFTQGQEQLEKQDPKFINRTQLFLGQLLQGNMSLLLRNVSLSDEGTYTCFVNVGNSSSAAVSLQVAAFYTKPTLHLEPSQSIEGLKPGDQVTVTCHTYRGYPQAEILWQDGSGKNLTENVTTSQVANEEGLFHVQSSIRVTLETNDTYTCLVYNPLLQAMTHASLSVTGQHLSFPLVAVWVTIVLCACLLGLLVALACVCRKQLKQTCEEEQEEAANEEHEENGELKTAMQPLKASSAEGDDSSTLE
ncbi:CD276 antigen [Hyla sarda]|uniref:CD276 antigen n=1 Tax=Hyla sarda TaxID=327740 RepID=UPI0024C2A99E|nr:CD276 antigen [Hyla sarda]XP_056428741.1 CD276 antigen [Hyla sarda]XP_056428742.1 CD276 antigen [Hyla sarda]